MSLVKKSKNMLSFISSQKEVLLLLTVQMSVTVTAKITYAFPKQATNTAKHKMDANTQPVK